MNTGKLKLLDQMRNVMRIKHYSLKTEKSYIQWVRRYSYFHNKQHPDNMSALDVQKFLNYLAVEQNVSASTQNQALNAIVFLYKQVLKKELGLVDAIRARKPKYLPVVLTVEETMPSLPVGLTYGLTVTGPNKDDCSGVRLGLVIK